MESHGCLKCANTLHIVTICSVMWFVIPLYEFDFFLLWVWYYVMRLYCYAM